MSDSLEEKVIRFPGGIPGFPNRERFLLVELAPEGAFLELRSVDDPDLAMLVTVPWLFFPDYAPTLSDEEQAELGIEKPDDATVFCAVSTDDEADVLHVNLLGPFVVNQQSRLGRQLVLAGTDYPSRARVELSIAS